MNSYTRRQVCQLGLSGLAGLTLFDLAACGGSGGSAGNASTGGGSETLQLSFWGDASRSKLTKNAINAYHQQHSNVTINTWYADFNSYFNKLNTQIAGGSSPDLIQMDISYVRQYVGDHQLLDLTSLINDKTIDLSDFDQGVLANSMDAKVLYGIPLGGNYECLVYDTVFVQQAGVGAPPATWTWDNFATYTSQLSKALASQKVYGAADSSGAIDLFEIWVRQHGTELYTADGKIAFTADVVASWLDYWDKLRKAGGCAPAETQALDTSNGPASSLLTQKKAVFTSAHSNQFHGYQVLSTHKYALQIVPSGDKPGLYLKPSMLMSISAKSKYANEAAAFINFLIVKPEGAKAIGLDRGIPGSARARAALLPSLKAEDKAVLAYADQVAQSGQSSPRTILDPKAAGKLLTELHIAAQSVGFGKQSAMAAANSFYQNAVKILS